MNIDNNNYYRSFLLNVGLIVIVVLSLLGYSYYSTTLITVDYTPLHQTIDNVKLDATKAHLWFEEIIGGDRHEDIDTVWSHLDQAERGIKAYLTGGEGTRGTILPVENPDLRQDIHALYNNLLAFRNLTEERFELRGDAIAGTDIDQRYDTLFSEFIALTDVIDMKINELIEKEVRAHRIIEGALTFITLFLFINAGIFYSRNQRLQREHTLMLESEINERKQTENKMRELRNKLAHVERIHTLGEMTAILAHEINQPLAAISSYAEGCIIRLKSGKGEDKIAEILIALAKVTEQAGRASNLISNIRGLLRKDEPDREQLDVNNLINTVADLLNPEAHINQTTIMLELGDDLPLINGNAIQLQQVILNLARNGIEAMRKINPTLRRLTIISTGRGDAMIEVVVRDMGSGLSSENNDPFFAPFSTTKTYGLGLGLSICRTIVEAHGGMINFDPNVEVGTVIRFTLPVSNEGSADDN